MQLLRFSTLVLFVIFLSSCATTVDYREPSTILLSSDKQSHALLSDLRAALEEKNYNVRTFNSSLGILSTAPRYFSYSSEKGTGRGQQVIQVKIEGASVKIKMIYKCKSGEQKEYIPCDLADNGANTKIHRIDSMLMKLVKMNL